jgi:MFS family permease
MIRDLKCTEFQATLGLSVYPIGLGIVPMFTAAPSEEFGRWQLFFWSTIGFELCFFMIAMFVLFIMGFCLSLNLASVQIGPQTFKPSSLVDSYKAGLHQQEPRWFLGPLLIYGWLRSECMVLACGEYVLPSLSIKCSRGLPMAFFSLISFFTLGVGPIMGGFIEMNPNLEWRWIEWIQMTCGFIHTPNASLN